ncbi:hypothetical protein U9M48_005613 [Paspalum notatum var. saurae]|uniref:Disease resistance protein RPM1 n=1 Tax=Paspalum notatum var. saurae TaxID=547442 RepID=A0AAQ3PM83_PASNO
MEATALSIGKSVVSGVVGYAKSAVAEEVALLLGVARDQAFIKDELEMMLSFLMAAHEEGDKHKVNETWVRQVRVVAYDVEDSLMDFAVRVQKQSCWRWRTLRDRRHVAKLMKDLRARVEDVSQRYLRYRPVMASASKIATSGGDTDATAIAMFGINEARLKQSRLDLTQLINKEGEDLAVVAVWGTNGSVGHTSIIWDAYENSDTQKNFPCRAWVKVTHPFSPKEFIRSLLEEFRTAVGVNFLLQTEKTGQELVEEFNSYVNEKRCLIVLDDLSTVQEWNRVKKCFPTNNRGNRIVVSTTDVEVASLCVGQNSVVSEIKQLSADQTIYAFYKEHEPIARPSVQISTMSATVQRTEDEVENTRTESSQDVSYSIELVSNSKLPISDIQEDQSNAADEEIEGHTRRGMNAGAVEESQLVGRETEKELIANLILEHSNEHLEVIAVWGMGGIGKTTLVTDVYQRQDLNERFTKRAFVTVMRPFKLQELLRSIAIQLDAKAPQKKNAMDFAHDNENNYASMSVVHLTRALDRLSQNIKCLIVVDDLLYTTEWDTIKVAFREIENACWTIVISTRHKDIAEHCCHQKPAECIHKLSLLKVEEAHKLFIEKVFKKTIDLDKEYPDLVEPAKLILNKCDGLPLVIVTIGGFLGEQKTKSAVDWRQLNEHINSELEMNPKIGRIKTVLKTSYDGLPYYLKPCFLYMSIFPEDCNISRRHLVRRWAVEGYTAEARDKSCMEIAGGYFEQLIGRSMILPAYESIFSRQKADSCKLHDLIRDISISMSMEENLVFRLEEGCSSNTQGTVRHLAISSNWEGDEDEFQSIVDMSRIRSLTVFGKWKPFYISDKMRFLRVLDLENTDRLTNHCLKHIGKLLHLRYLSLRRCGNIFCLPDSVGELTQLEVLDIKWTRIQILPKTIIRLRKLRFLHAGMGIVGDPKTSCFHKCGQLCLVQLQACLGVTPDTSEWDADDESSRRDRCAMACCAALPPIMMGMEFPGYVGGVTVPSGMRRVKSLQGLRCVHLAWGNAVVEEIKGLTGLRKLGVVGISERNSRNLCSAISKLTHLESLWLWSEKLDLSACMDGMESPPENLQSLKLYGEMAKLPGWIKGLQNLVKLTLKGTGLSLGDAAAVLMQDIGELRNLSILRLDEWYLNINKGEVHFKSGLFMSLKVLDLNIRYGQWDHIGSVKFDAGATPRLEVLHLAFGGNTSFSGLEYLRSIREVRLRFLGDKSKDTLSPVMREQLDKIKRGHVLKVDYSRS